MMQVDTATVVGLVPRTAQPGAVSPRVTRAVSGRAARPDSIHISDSAHSLSRQRSEQIRADRIERIRQQIAEGTYVTEERVSVAAAALARTLSD